MQETTEIKNKANVKVIGITVLLLAVGIGAGIAGKNFWNRYNAERENIKRQINALTEKQQIIADLEDKLDRAEKDVRILMEAKPSDAGKQHGIVQVKDAYLLARIAEDRLQYANDIQTAKQLLQLAQDNLANMGDPEIVKVKSILAADQSKLNNLNYPAVHEINDKLVLMDKLMNNLALKNSATDEAAASKVEPQKEKKNMRFDKEWKQSLNKMLEDLKTVVKVKKKSDLDADVDMSYINTEISKAQFKLLIEQIRWAVFYRDTVVYTRSVKNAQTLLTQLFDNNNDEVKQFSDALNYLAEVKIQPDVPSIKDSVNALQAILVG